MPCLLSAEPAARLTLLPTGQTAQTTRMNVGLFCHISV